MSPLVLLLAVLAPFASAKDKPAVSHDGSFELAVPRDYFVEKDKAGSFDMSGRIKRLMVLRAQGSSQVNGPRVWISSCWPGARPGMAPAEILEELRREEARGHAQYHADLYDHYLTGIETKALANGMTLHYFFDGLIDRKTREVKLPSIFAILQSGDSLYAIDPSGAGRDDRTFWFLPVLEAMRPVSGKPAKSDW